MEMMMFLLSNHTFRIVTLGCTLLGVVSGMLGCFATLRKESLLGDAISHASLPGICLIFLITKSKNIEVLLTGALITGLICIGIINIIKNYTKIKLDSILAFVLSVFFGFGMVLLSYLNKLPGANKSGLNKFIFGQASTFIKRDINIIIIVGTLILLLILLFWKEFKIVSFDSEFSKTMGIPSKSIDILISILIVAMVIVGIQAVGIVLISAMLISPAVAARQWTNKLSIMVILSGIFGGIGGILGTLISISENNIPTGPVVVLVISLIAIFSILFSYKRGIIFKIIYYRKRKKEILREYKRRGDKNEIYVGNYNNSDVSGKFL